MKDMNKQNVVYTGDRLLFRLKKKEILSRATVRMKLEDTVLSEKKGRHKRK